MRSLLWLWSSVCPARLLRRCGGLVGCWLLLELAAGPALSQVRPASARKPVVAAPAGKAPAAKPSLPPADPPAVRTKLAQAATLTGVFKESEALAVYQSILKTVPAHYLALCQAAVLSVKIGSRYSDETRRAAYFDVARQYADRALLQQPEAGESNYALALVLFSQATLLPAGARLHVFRDIRAHVYLATEQRPDWPEAWQLRGRWQYRVAHYNLLERLYSKLVLGGVPAGGDSREAIASLEKAHQMAPQNIPFSYDLARMYLYQGRRRRAIAVLREMEKLPPITSEDLVVSRLGRQLLPPLLRADARRQKRLARQNPPVPPTSPIPAPEAVPPLRPLPNDTIHRRQ